MALTGTDRGTGSHNSSSLTFTLSPDSNFAAGSMAVLCIAVDNADSSGQAHSTFTVVDTLGNVWTRRASPLYDPGSASAGVEGAIFTTPQTLGALQTGTVITVTFDALTVAKAWTLMEVAPGAGNAVSFVTSGVNTGAGTGTPTVTTGSITSGDMVVGCGHAENTDSWAGDADTSNGNWSAHQHNGVGTTTSAISITSQRKVVTGTATQTYNPTRTSSDCILSYIVLHESAAYSMTTVAGSFSVSGQTPSLLRALKLAAVAGAVAVTGNATPLVRTRIAGVDAGAVSVTGNTAALSLGKRMAVDAGAQAVSGQTVAFPRTWILSADAGSTAVSGQAATLSTAHLISASAGVYSTTGNDATLTEGGASGYTIAVDAGAHAVSGQAATLSLAHKIAVDAGSIAVTGNPAIAGSGHLLSPAVGSIAASGNAAALRWARALPAEAGSAASTGSEVTFFRGLRVVAAAGAYAVTGNSATLTPDQVDHLTLSAQAGTVQVTGNPATLIPPSRGGRGGGASFAYAQGNAPSPHPAVAIPQSVVVEHGPVAQISAITTVIGVESESFVGEIFVAASSAAPEPQAPEIAGFLSAIAVPFPVLPRRAPEASISDEEILAAMVYLMTE